MTDQDPVQSTAVDETEAADHKAALASNAVAMGDWLNRPTHPRQPREAAAPKAD